MNLLGLPGGTRLATLAAVRGVWFAMARRNHGRRTTVRLRHKIVGGLFAALGMSCLGGCMLITALLMDQFMAGSTLELAVLALCLGVAGLSSLLLSWQQLVLAPRRERMERAFSPTLRLPAEGAKQ
jgi:hypothetical protein